MLNACPYHYILCVTEQRISKVTVLKVQSLAQSASALRTLEILGARSSCSSYLNIETYSIISCW